MIDLKPQQFDFEKDFISKLKCIPMVVRYKLDLCGVKLSLKEWNALSLQNRQALTEKPCVSKEEVNNYKEDLIDVVKSVTGAEPSLFEPEERPLWENRDKIPAQLIDKLTTNNSSMTLDQWQHLATLQRFVLIKLSRASHEGKNFIPALKEFNVI